MRSQWLNYLYIQVCSPLCLLELAYDDLLLIHIIHKSSPSTNSLSSLFLFTLLADVIGSIAFNPADYSIVSCSGSRKHRFEFESDEQSDNDGKDRNGGSGQSMIKKSNTELAIWKFEYF